MMRATPGLAVALLLAGCGTSDQPAPAPSEADVAAPPGDAGTWETYRARLEAIAHEVAQR